MNTYHNLKLLSKRTFWVVLFALLFNVKGNAQAINENFGNVPSLFTSGWAQQNLSTPVGTVPTWFQGAATVFPAYSSPDSSYIGVNYNSVAGAATISNWLFVPSRTFNNGDIISFFTRTSTPGATVYPDRLELRLSTNGTSTNVGATNTSVGDFTTVLLTVNPSLTTTGYPSTWTQYSATISGLSGPTAGRVAFRYFVTNGGPSGANSDFIGIDNFVYTPAGSGAPEVSASSPLLSPYTIIPVSQASANYPVTINVNNSGTTSAATVNCTTKVYKSPNFTTPIQTLTNSVTNLAASASNAVSMGNFVHTGAGGYLLEHFVTGNTGSINNDTVYTSLTLDNNFYARDDNNPTSRFGIGAGPTGYIGSMYNITNAVQMDSVIFALYKYGTDVTSGDGVGDSTRITVFSVSGGLPTTIIGRTAKRVFTPADTLGPVVYRMKMFNTTGGQLTLTPGTYFVAITEYNTNIGMLVTNTIFTNNTVYAGWTGQAFTPVENFGANFAKTPIIRPYFITACAVTATATTTQATCTAANGSATATPAGGTTPYTYAWSSGANAATANNLAAGTYTVTITDAAACAVTATATVTSNTVALTATSSTTNSNCGAATGSATVTPSNGTAPYTYAWSNGGNTQTINNISAGSYSVTMTDANGCVGSVSGIAVGNPNAPTASITGFNSVLCNGAATGNATAGATGGTSPYTFVWSNGANTAAATGLAAGTYTVTVTDAASCLSTVGVTISQPSAMSVTTNSSTTMNVACNGGSDGMAGVTVSGGTSGYTYMWSNAAVTADITGLTAGTYTVTVLDANSCSSTHSVTVTEPATALSATTTGTNLSCNGDNSGAATSTVTGGTAPYSYTWSNGAITDNITGLAAGTYTPTIVDANSCSTVGAEVTITEPAAIAAASTVTDASLAGSSDGAVNLSVSGGTTPYTFAWSNSATTEDISGLAAGSYVVTITDANGCTSVSTHTVADGPIAVGVTNGNININVFPNPASDKAVLSVELANASDMTIQITNVTGQVLQTINASAVTNNQFSLEMTEWAAGVYFVRVTAGQDTATYRLTKK